MMTRLNRWMLLPLAIGLLNLSVATPALTQEKQVRTLTVAGDAQVQIPTTMTGVKVGVEAQGKDANTVQAEAARRTAAVLALLKARKVQNLETTDVQLEPVDNYERGSGNQVFNQIVGYRAMNTVSFQVPNAQAGSLLSETVKAGANQVNSLTFFSADDVIEAAQKQAIREAFQNAEQKASAALNAMKATQQEVTNVQIDAPRPNVISREFNRREFNRSGVELAGEVVFPITPVSSGFQIVSATVTLTVRY
jgi:uncharacterized protein YggE